MEKSVKVLEKCYVLAGILGTRTSSHCVFYCSRRSSIKDVCTEGGKAQCRQQWTRGSIFTVFLWRALWMTRKDDGDGNSQNSLRRAKLQSNRRH